MASFSAFLKSAQTQDWVIFGGVLLLCFYIQSRIYDWPSTNQLHAAGLFIWIGMAGLMNGLIYFRYGSQQSLNWLSGYMLEFVFSIENVFVFHFVVRAFRVPRRHAQKALTFVVVSQLMFELVFYMGLAYRLRQSDLLPYALGIWLLYLGYMAAFEGKHEDIVFEETWVYRGSTWLLGPRLYPKYERTVAFFIRGKEGFGVTMLFIATVCLVVTDFFLEVDVTLTKIEEMQQHYLAFTSSALAAFALPELFFVSRDLFARFYMLKYGISFVLVMFGLQLLLHHWISIPTLWQSAIMMAVMSICMVLSRLYPGLSDLDADREDDSDDDAANPNSPRGLHEDEKFERTVCAEDDEGGYALPEYLWQQAPDQRLETAFESMAQWLTMA